MPAGGFVRTTANCPVGKVVLAGGAQVVGEGSAEFRTRVQESAPGTIGGGAQSVWLAAVRNYSVNPHTIGVFAVCASKPAGYQVIRKDTSVAAGGFLRTTANCPAGLVVNGGGASVIGAGTANFGTSLQESAPGTTGSPAVVGAPGRRAQRLRGAHDRRPRRLLAHPGRLPGRPQGRPGRLTRTTAPTERGAGST